MTYREAGSSSTVRCAGRSPAIEAAWPRRAAGTNFPGTSVTNWTAQQEQGSADVLVTQEGGSTQKAHLSSDGGQYQTIRWGSLVGTVSADHCDIICWNCTRSPEGNNPKLVWQRKNTEVDVLHVRRRASLIISFAQAFVEVSMSQVVYFTHLDVGYTLDTSMEVLDL